MPKGRAYKKKRYNRRRKRKMQISRPLKVAFPKTQLVNMKWVKYVPIDSDGLALSFQIFRANSIWDPDESLGVGQRTALGWSQWRQFYENYTVVGSKFSAMAYTGVNTSQISNVVGVYLSNDPLPVSSLDYRTLAEQGKGSYKIISPVQTAGMKTPLRSSFSAKKFFNVKDIKDNQERLGAPFTTNPPKGGDAYYILYTQPLDQQTNTGRLDVLVTIEYSVLLSDPLQLEHPVV